LNVANATILVINDLINDVSANQEERKKKEEEDEKKRKEEEERKKAAIANMSLHYGGYLARVGVLTFTDQFHLYSLSAFFLECQ